MLLYSVSEIPSNSQMLIGFDKNLKDVSERNNRQLLLNKIDFRSKTMLLKCLKKMDR